jgi:hypothetical protein
MKNNLKDNYASNQDAICNNGLNSAVIIKPSDETFESLLTGTESDYDNCFILTPENYELLITEPVENINNTIEDLLRDLAYISNSKSNDDVWYGLQMNKSGIIGIGNACNTTARNQLLSGGDESGATIQGVKIASIKTIGSIIQLLIAGVGGAVGLLTKPATCSVLIINELDEPLMYSDEYNIHGKPSLKTSPIEGKIKYGNATYYQAGFISTQKRDAALYGTLYGFVMKHNETDLAFGVECPLTSLYSDNNCYCAFGITAEAAANKTDKNNKTFSKATQSGINISIQCGSKSGSNAYYVARVYKDNNDSRTIARL